MKRICLLFLSFLILLHMPLTADATSTTITVEVTEPIYQLSIPSDLTIAYQTETCSLSVPSIITSSGFKEGMHLTIAVSHSGAFSCPDVSTTIPFAFYMVTSNGSIDWNSGDYLIFDRMEDGGISQTGRISDGTVPTGMLLTFSLSDWENAHPGKYSTTITDTVSFATS